MYNIVKNGAHAQHGTYEIIADFEADIATASTNLAPGSTIFCIENSTVYVLTPSKEWVEKG